MDKTIENFENYIKKNGEQDVDSIDVDRLFKIVDIFKDLKEVEKMNNYGNEYNRGYREYNEYNGYDEYNRRGVDSKYKASKYMDSMKGNYEAYEEDRNEYNRGNYGVKEDGLHDLESMLHSNHKLLKYIKETATSPEEKEIVRKYFQKFSELMNV